MGTEPPSNTSNMAGLLLTAVVLIILSMIFSASESAFLSINKLRVRLLKNKKDKNALRTWKLLSNRDRLINTLLVGNNIVNIAISSILTIIALDLFGSAGVGIATFAATLLLLIFGEISPKVVATRHPEKIAFFFSGFINIVEIILWPIVFLLTGISTLCLKVLGINQNKKQVSYTEEEIKTFLDVGNEEGVLGSNEKNMMNRVFKFTDLEAKDVMVPRKKLFTVKLDATFNEIMELCQRTRLSRFPVIKENIDDIVGVIYLKDLLAYKTREKEFSVEQAMRSPLFILKTKKMSSVQQMLRENHQSLAIVIDEYSGTYGIITIEDMNREIFGQMNDEYSYGSKKKEINIEEKDNTCVSGQTRLSEINEQLHISLESQCCETLGGYMCEILGRIPLEKESIIREGYKFTVHALDDKRVSSVHIQKIKNEEEES